MIKLHEESLENNLLKECCEDNNVDIKDIKEMMRIEEEYATRSRRYWITEKLKDIVESSFNS